MEYLSHLTEPVLSFATGLLFGYAIWARKRNDEQTEEIDDDDSDWEVLTLHRYTNSIEQELYSRILVFRGYISLFRIFQMGPATTS